MKDFNDAIKALATASIVAFDTETTGLNVREAECLGLGIAVNEEHGWYFSNPVLIKGILEKLHGKKLVAWNAYFDLEIIRNNYGVDLWDSLHADAILVKHTVDENQPFALKEVAAKLYGTDSKKEQEEVKQSIKDNGGKPNEFKYCDEAILAKYCIKDCKLTYKLYKHYNKQLFEEGLVQFFYEDEVMPLYKEVTRFMMARGVPVDVKLLKSMQKDIEVDMNNIKYDILTAIDPYLDKFRQWYLDKNVHPDCMAVKQELIRMSGCDVKKTTSGKYSTAKGELLKHDHPYINYLLGKNGIDTDVLTQARLACVGDEEMFNISSKDHLKRLFFDKLGEEPTSKTDKGNPQVNNFFIDKLAEKYEWCGWLSDYNKLSKLKGSYIDRILELQENGRFHPQYFQHRTVSGRYGSDLQQLPRPSNEFSDVVCKYRNRIRNAFISSKSWKFIDSDYESLEPHVFSHVSGDDGLKNIFRNGHDFYSTIAIDTEGLSGVSADKSADDYLGVVDKEKRQSAKAYSLGIPYGMESFALGKTLKIEQEAAELLIKKYLDAYPALASWMRKSNNAMIHKGVVVSEAGRKRRFKQERGIYWRYGEKVLNSLELWKEYHQEPKKYEQAKWARRQVKNALNNAKNFQIQSLSASIVNRATIAINRMIKKLGSDGYVCAQIHDQIIVHCEEDRAEEIAMEMRIIMENIYKLDVELRAPFEIGDNFGETH